MKVMFPGSWYIHEVHCTLIYLGEVGKVKINRPNLETCVERLNTQIEPGFVKVKGIELFGQKDHTVLTLDSFKLGSWRTFLDKELARYEIRSASQYSYKPHITVNKHAPSDVPVPPWEPFYMPDQVWVDRPQVWWGDLATSTNI
jgi:2'-5' RNA ligase